jgi:hypothetical protein
VLGGDMAHNEKRKQVIQGAESCYSSIFLGINSSC